MLAERDKDMSEQTLNEKPSYMQQLDQWTDAYVIAPLFTTSEEEGGEQEELTEETLRQVKYAIRTKVLDSYKNGCRAGAGAVRKEQREAHAHMRAN